MKISSMLAMGLFVVGYADVAAAQSDNPSPWMVTVTAGPRYFLDGSRDAFSRETVGFAGGLIVGRTLTSPALPVELALELGFEAEDNKGELHQSFDTTVVTLNPTLGLSLRWRARRWLLPYVRAHAGAAWQAVTLEARDGSGTFDGDAWTFRGGAGLGLMFQTGTFASEGRFRALRFVATLEGGAIYAMPSELSITSRAPADDLAARDRVASPAVRLGDLDTSATYVRVGVGFRF